jgi:tRNA-dihydrouridine synthase A
VPPLRYAVVQQLKKDFPYLTICVNGGITTTAQITEQLQHVDGVMLGREAYHNPWWLASWDSAFFDAEPALPSPSSPVRPEPVEGLTREIVEAQMCDYMVQQAALHGTPWSTIARHMLGLRCRVHAAGVRCGATTGLSPCHPMR